jgi:hypothetical protein
MSLFFINFIEFLKKVWLILSVILILFILIRKADDESLNSFKLPFVSNSKKAEKLFNNIIWAGILIYFSFGLIFSTKYFL